MKTIRNTMTLVGVSLTLFALCTAGAKAQGLSSINVTGTFTLPFEARWGPMTLPAGDYNLYYGSLTIAGTRLVEVKGQAEGSPHGFLLTKEQDSISTTKSALICIRQGDRRIVRELQMAPIGETVSFPLPHSVKLLAHQQNGNVYARLAEAPVIERVPVNTSGR